MANFAHLGSSGIPSSEFLQTYWSVDSVRLQINGKLRFYYNDADITGTETNLAKIGRWNPVREVTPGIWTFPFAVPSINYALNYFETSSSFAYSEFAGDWALGNDIYFRRIFFSRQNGDWNDANTWTYNPTHIGPIFGPGIYPNFSSDSVQIGGGSNGVNNHIVVLNVNNPFSSPATVGIALGTGTNNTGTLDLGTNTLNGNIFNMNDLSTLIIGSTDGISTLGNATGGVLTDVVRNFHLNGIYHYRGIVNQITGNGLPAGINSLIVENLGPVGNYTLTLGNNLDIVDSLTIRSGRLDIGNNQVNTTSLVAHFRINDDAVLALGGTSNMLSAVNSYQSYLIDQNSYLEFYGNNQVISDLPLSLTQSFLSDTGGFGNVITTNNGTKYVNSALLIRGNLINQNLSNLTIDDAINSVRVIGSVINSAAIFNQGIIEIGN